MGEWVNKRVSGGNHTGWPGLTGCVLSWPVVCSGQWSGPLNWPLALLKCCYPGGGSVVLWVSDRARARVLWCGRCQTELELECCAVGGVRQSYLLMTGHWCHSDTGQCSMWTVHFTLGSLQFTLCIVKQTWPNVDFRMFSELLCVFKMEITSTTSLWVAMFGSLCASL